MSKSSDAVRTAFANGYRVLVDGTVVGTRGVRKLRCVKHGYLRFNVRLGTRVIPIYVHKLAAYQKYGEPALSTGTEVRHMNGVSSDNRPANLLLGSRLENIMDIPSDKRRDKALRAAASLRKLTDSQVAELRAARVGGAKYSELTKRYGITKSTVSYIVQGITYSRAIAAIASATTHNNARTEATCLRVAPTLSTPSR